MLLRIFRIRRMSTQRIKNSSKSSLPPQPLLTTENTSSAPDMAPLKDDINDVVSSEDQQHQEFHNALASSSCSSSPDRSLMSVGTAALSFSSADYSPIISKNSKTYTNVPPPVNIYADGGEANHPDDTSGGLDDTAEGNDWVDFPPQSFLSPNSQDAGQLSSTSDDFGRITSFTIITEDDANNINEDEDAAHARKCLFENIDVTWDGFITDDDEPTTSSLLTIETLQTEITQLTEELTQTKKRLESAKASNEALNEAHDKKHKELEQLNQDMDKFSDIIMLCMQQLRERNATLQSENEELKLSNKDMSVRLNILTKCTEALNHAHDLKSEECEDLKRDMERFAETFAAQHNSLEELEGRLRKVMSSERRELQHSNEKEVKRSRRKSGRGHEMERIDELSDDEDNNETD